MARKTKLRIILKIKMVRESYEMKMMTTNRYSYNNRRKIDRQKVPSLITPERNQNFGATAIFISRRTMIILGVLTALFFISTVANIGYLIYKDNAVSKYGLKYFHGNLYLLWYTLTRFQSFESKSFTLSDGLFR